MRLATFQNSAGAVLPGMDKDGKLISLRALGFVTLEQIIAQWDEVRPQIERFDGPAEPGARLRAPLLRPGKIFCVGLNYRDHAIETKMEIPQVPTIFSKFNNTIIGPGENIVLPKNSSRPDYEA